jgi:hypothetical protein
MQNNITAIDDFLTFSWEMHLLIFFILESSTVDRMFGLSGYRLNYFEKDNRSATLTLFSNDKIGKTLLVIRYSYYIELYFAMKHWHYNDFCIHLLFAFQRTIIASFEVLDEVAVVYEETLDSDDL